MDISPWRDAGKRMTVFGIPAPLFTLYAAWFHWPSMDTLYLCTALLLFFKVLDLMGFSLKVMLQRIIHLLRGRHISGRPWWYRKRLE
jgi:intracellular multiplication protein IcmT